MWSGMSVGRGYALWVGLGDEEADLVHRQSRKEWRRIFLVTLNRHRGYISHASCSSHCSILGGRSGIRIPRGLKQASRELECRR